MLRKDQRIAIYMEGSVADYSGKMGFGILRYSPNPLACIVDSHTAGGNAKDYTGIPRDVPIVATVEEAAAVGSEVFVLGIAPAGGLIPESWYPVIDKAVNSGMSIVN